MAHKTYNTLWREVMQTLIQLLEMETSPNSPPSLSTTTNTLNNTSTTSRPSTATKLSTTTNTTNATTNVTNTTNTTNTTMRKWVNAKTGFQFYGQLYLGYVSVARGLEDCYDQMAHPMKRKAVKEALRPVLGRLVELYDILSVFVGDEFIPMDTVLASMGVTPSALQLAVPRFFKEERSRELEERDKLLTALLAQYTVKLESEGGRLGHPLEILDTPVANMSLEEAVRIIQVNERGRQGRKKCQEAREARSRDRVLLAPPAMEPDAAAVLIQKTFRGHLTRKKTKAAREDELVFLGMKASNRKKDVDLIEKAEATRARRKLIQNQNELEYQQAIQQMRQAILDQEGPDIKEQLQDDVRKFFLAHKEQLGKFPVFPNEQEGGSAKMLNPLMKVPSSKTAAKPPAPASPKTAAKGTRPTTTSKTTTTTSKTLSKTPSSTSKPAPPTAKSGISRPVTKGTKKEPGSGNNNLFTPIITPSNFLPDIHTAVQDYLSVWAERDEEANFAQKHDIDLVRETLRPQIESEIRKQVDELLREELENLKNAVEKKKQKKKGKKKKGDAKSTEPKKEKKEKKEKKKKTRKGPKDPTADRSIQSLYAELVSMNIVVNCPTTNSKLSDFVAVYSPNSLPDTLVPPSPEQSRPVPHVLPAHASLFGVLQTIMNICILPLGSPPSVSSSLPPPLVPRSLLLVAPPCYGKSMLCNIIANETGSVLLNLDPVNLVNANTSRSVSLVVHMAFKVAKAMSPSVIYIDNVEQIFVKPKKKPKAEKNKVEPEGEAPTEETSKPLGVAEIATLMRKELVSQINALQPGDRVLVIGMTKQPWVGTMGGGSMGFDRQLLIPAPDPASLTLLWTKLIQDNARDLAHGESLILATLAQSLPPGLVQRIVETVVKGNGDKRPLQSQDFVGHMAKLPSGQELKAEKTQVAAWWHSNKRGPARLLTLVDPNGGVVDPPSRPLAASSKGKKPAAKPATKK